MRALRIRRRPRTAVLLFVAVAVVAWLLLTRAGMYQAPAVFCGAALGWWTARPFVRGRR